MTGIQHTKPLLVHVYRRVFVDKCDNQELWVSGITSLFIPSVTECVKCFMLYCINVWRVTTGNDLLKPQRLCTWLLRLNCEIHSSEFEAKRQWVKSLKAFGCLKSGLFLTCSFPDMHIIRIIIIVIVIIVYYSWHRPYSNAQYHVKSIRWRKRFSGQSPNTINPLVVRAVLSMWDICGFYSREQSFHCLPQLMTRVLSFQCST